MNQAIQFETVVENGVIRIPTKYAGAALDIVEVTLIPLSKGDAKIKPRQRIGAISSDDFVALSIDTRDWTFDREEANARG